MVNKQGRPKTYKEGEEFVSINITKVVRDKLRAVGNMGENYSDVISKLLEKKK